MDIVIKNLKQETLSSNYKTFFFRDFLIITGIQVLLIRYYVW